MGNEADDFMLWKLECMTNPTLRWEMVAFVAWCVGGREALRAMMPTCPHPEPPAYDWEQDGL